MRPKVILIGCVVQFIYYVKKGGNVGIVQSAGAVVYKAHHAVGINDAVERHAPKLEQVDFLLVHSGNGIVRVGHANEWNILFLPIVPKRFRCIGPNGEQDRSSGRELGIRIAEARQLRAAMYSDKPAQKRKHNGLLFEII